MTDFFSDDNIRHRVWLLWHRTTNLIFKYAETPFAAHGISYPQFMVLVTMNSIGETSTSTEISKRLDRSPNTISTMLDRMETSGLVRKVRDMPDRRQVRVAMTPKARKKLTGAIQAGFGTVEKLTCDFSDEELQTLATLIQKLASRACKELEASASQTPASR